MSASSEALVRDLSEDFADSGTGACLSGSNAGYSGAGTGSAGGLSPPVASRSIHSSPRASTVQFHLDSRASSPTVDALSRSIPVSSIGSPRGDRQEYVNGSPVIQKRRHNMSVDQFLDWCKELKMMPNVLSRVEVVQIFKRAQTTGYPGSHGSGVHGFLSREAFVDAVGQLGLEAYSKEPFCDEYAEAHEKICAFLLDFLPGSSREAHDRFLYGRGPRR